MLPGCYVCFVFNLQKKHEERQRLIHHLRTKNEIGVIITQTTERIAALNMQKYVVKT